MASNCVEMGSRKQQHKYSTDTRIASKGPPCVPPGMLLPGDEVVRDGAFVAPSLDLKDEYTNGLTSLRDSS